jgi:putative PIN family toxin of toxin-antitoxin system
MRVVIDTNCLRASIPPKSPFYDLYRAFEEGLFTWYVSTEILLEYEEILSLTYSEQTAHLILHTLAVAPNIVFAEPFYRWELIESDPDDNKFSDLAIGVNADYLVSNDKDYAILERISFPSLTVISLQEFLALIRGVDN